MPPIIGTAMRCITSEPVPVLHMIGSKPAMMATTVIIFGRTRSTAPRMMAAFRSARVKGRCAAAHSALHLGEGVVEIDEHHDARLGRDARQCNEPHGYRDRKVEAQRPQQPEPAYQREWQGQHDDQGFGERPEVQIEQQEYDQQRDRDDNLEPGLGPLQVFELSAPGHVIAGRECHACRDGLLRFGDIAAEVAIPDVDEDVSGELAVLGADGRRAARRA